MAHHDVLLPDYFQYGSSAGAGFATIVQPTATGHEVRVARQSQGIHRLSLNASLLTPALAKELKGFALARRGSLHSFKVKDFSDFTTNVDGESAPDDEDAILGTGDGTTTTFQLVKTYETDGPAPYIRTIALPESGTVVVALDGVNTTSFTVNGSGQVVLNSAPANGVIVTAGCRFYVPVRFVLDVDKWARLVADAYQLWSTPLMDVQEVLGEVEQPERKPTGGGRDWGSTAVAIYPAFADGELIKLTPTGTTIDIVLPVPTYQGSGPLIFTVHVPAAASQNVQVRDDQGNAIGSAFGSGGATKYLGLSRSGSDVTWVLHG